MKKNELLNLMKKDIERLIAKSLNSTHGYACDINNIEKTIQVVKKLNDNDLTRVYNVKNEKGYNLGNVWEANIIKMFNGTYTKVNTKGCDCIIKGKPYEIKTCINDKPHAISSDKNDILVVIANNKNIELRIIKSSYLKAHNELIGVERMTKTTLLNNSTFIKVII